jgi:hypothetical protein
MICRRRRNLIAAQKSRILAVLEVERFIAGAMWSMRVHREARAGARVVAGPHGEVLRVESVSLSGYGIQTVAMPLRVRPEISARVGQRWVEADLMMGVRGDGNGKKWRPGDR